MKLVEKINIAYELSRERKYYSVLESSLIGLAHITTIDKEIVNTVISLIYTIIKKTKTKKYKSNDSSILITLDEIVKNNVLLAYRIEQMEKHRNQVKKLLKEIFGETLKLLATHTMLKEYFELQQNDLEKEIENSKGKNWRKIELVFKKLKPE